MFIHYRTQGIIIKKRERGEADELFVIYTKEFGKLEILGKAIRKIKSKLRTGADIFYLSDIEFIQGKALKTLTDAILIEKFENLRNDLRKLKIAQQIAEILDKLIKDQEKDEELWDLLQETLQKLNNPKVPITHDQLIYHYFLWNFIFLLGYSQNLYNCSICQKKLQLEKLFFNPKEGGIICSKCFQKIKKGKETTIATIKVLRILLKRDWETLNRLKFENKDLEALKTISKSLLLYFKKEASGHI